MKYMVIPMSLCLVLLCANFSSQQQAETARARQPINFYGVVTTNQQETYQVDTISIGGLYENIPVYSKPIDKNIDPATNTTKLNLSAIRSINPITNEQNIVPILNFNNRDYIEILVHWRDSQRSSSTFIIERNRQIFCNATIAKAIESSSETTPLCPLKVEKRLSFEAIINLQIDGHLVQEEYTTQQKQEIEKQLAALEHSAQTVESKETQKDLLARIKELRIQLQKLIC